MLLLKKQGLWQKRKVLWAADLLNLKRTNAMFLLQLSWIKHSSSMSCSCLRSTSQTGRMCTAVTPACAMDRQRAARMWVSEYVGTCLTSRYYQEVLNPWGWNMQRLQRLLPISMHLSDYHCMPLHRRLEDKIWAGKYCSAFHEASFEGNDSSLSAEAPYCPTTIGCPSSEVLSKSLTRNTTPTCRRGAMRLSMTNMPQFTYLKLKCNDDEINRNNILRLLWKKWILQSCTRPLQCEQELALLKVTCWKYCNTRPF